MAVVLIGVAVLLVVLANRSASGQKDTLASQTAPAASAAAKAGTDAAAKAVQATAGQSLCQAVPGLVRLSVQSLNPPRSNGGVNVSNAAVITSVVQVESLARRLCALPALGGHPKFCLASLGNWLQFIFGAADGRSWTVWTYGGGCMNVIGVGDQARTAMSDKRLWPTVFADLRGSHPLTS